MKAYPKHTYTGTFGDSKLNPLIKIQYTTQNLVAKAFILVPDQRSGSKNHKIASARSHTYLQSHSIYCMKAGSSHLIFQCTDNISNSAQKSYNTEAYMV